MTHSSPENAEPVAWRILCTTSGATGYLYTECLPFDPGPGVTVRREPEPLYDIRALVNALRTRAQCVPSREQIAKVVWHRYAPDSHETWEDEQYQAEYLDCADAILSAFTSPARCAPDRERVARVIATELGENFDRLVGEHFQPGFCQEDFYRSADAVLALTSPEHKSAPACKASHNSGEGDPAVTLDSVGADTATQPQCAPDREALVRAIQLSYARKDLEPTSATTLALYREDAEHAADAVLALTRPERCEGGK